MLINMPDLKKWQTMAKDVLGTDFMSDFFSDLGKSGPRYNLYRNASETIVLIELPYLQDLSQVKLVVKEQELIITGKLQIKFEHMEVIEEQLFSGEFKKVIPLPDEVNTKKVNAQYHKGILHVQLFPKLRKEGSPVAIQELK